MILETVWYEVSPYVYVVVGLASSLISNSDLGLMFSALLLVASFTILRMRRMYRSPERQWYRKYARPR